MTPVEFNATLQELGWGQRLLARRLGCDAMLVNRWANGKTPIPSQIAAWITRLRAAHAQQPKPADGWR